MLKCNVQVSEETITNIRGESSSEAAAVAEERQKIEERWVCINLQNP